MGRLIHRRIAGIELLGFSLAGEETVIAAPEFNACFDIGRAPREIIHIDNLCLSHGHMDHAAGLAYYFSQRRFVGIGAGRLIVHSGLVPPIQRLLAVWAEIERHDSPADIVAVEPHQDVELRRGLLLRPFAVNHCEFALGYTLIEVRRKLKPEFHGKTGPELVELKRRRVVIENDIEIPLLTYSGDTAVGRFLGLDFVRGSRVVLLECTFFEKDHLERTRAGRHIHVTDLPRVMEAWPDALIVLTHVTRRTDMRVAKHELGRTLSADDLERITFLMDRSP